MCRRVVAPVFIVVLSAGGAFGQFTSAVNVSNIDSYWDMSPSMDRDAGGNLHVAWKSWNDNAPTTIWYANNTGGFWKKEAITSTSSGSPGNVCLAISGDQVIHVFFSTAGGDWTAYECTRPVSGGTWTLPARLNVSGGSGSVYMTSVARDSTGGLYAMYIYLPNSGWGQYGRYRPASGNWGAEELVRNGGNGSSWPQSGWVTAKGTDFFITYYITTSRENYYRVRHPGGVFDPEVHVSPSGQQTRIAFAPNGEWALCWFDDRETCDLDFPIYAKFSSNQGASWGPVVEVSQNCYISRAPEIAYDASSNLYAYWEQSDYDGDRFDVYYRNRTAAGVWDPNATRLTDGNQRCGNPMNSITVSGNNLFNWYTKTTTNLYEDIWFRARWVQPLIVLNTVNLSHVVCYGSNPASDSFTVQNGGSGTLGYTISADAPWLSVTPTSGSSSGSASTINVNYDAASLPVGVHTAGVIIAAPGAFNTAQRIAVSVDVRTVPADFDHDGDVDQSDFAHLQRCLTGVGSPIFVTGCTDADLDHDLDVDMSDVNAMLACYTGPDRASGSLCCPY